MDSPLTCVLDHTSSQQASCHGCDVFETLRMASLFNSVASGSANMPGWVNARKGGFCRLLEGTLPAFRKGNRTRPPEWQQTSMMSQHDLSSTTCYPSILLQRLWVHVALPVIFVAAAKVKALSDFEDGSTKARIWWPFDSSPSWIAEQKE